MYAQKLKEALENNRGQNRPRGVGADTSKPLPPNPPGRASLDLSKSPRSSANLTDLVDSESDAPISEYDRDWYEMLTSVHNALSHTKYSISGRMGMSIWGCANGSTRKLSIVCPIESRENVKMWCLSTSRFSITEAEPDILAYQSPGSHQSPSRIWRIRIRWVPEAIFTAMPKVEMALRYSDGNPYAGEQVAVVNVLTLPALLDNCAHAWAEYARKQASDRRLRGLEEDIFSILERIMDLSFTEEGAGPLTEAECRHVVAFWVPFTKKHPDSPSMFAHCGMPLPQPPTTAQPGPSAGMVYPDQRFTNPRPAPAVPPKNKGRDLTANVKRKPELQPMRQPDRRPSFLDLFKPAVRKEAKAAQAERERRRSEDARKLAVDVSRGSRRMGESKQSRLKEMPSRRKDRNDNDRHHRNRKTRSSGSLSSSRGSRPTSTSSAPPDGTKVSAFDLSALERSASGNGRIPPRGLFADLYIEDDGEAL
ncbi:hypothetical protein Daus18300_007622 [Diaporthe australafricana]|uniref:Uncharacterized protein n=1 Tax=Diaporthe australafricana TaxID=127596 RepID=A0ABR3WLZ8_9PEZI